MQPVSGQLLGKYIPAAKNIHVTIEERCFLWLRCHDIRTKFSKDWFRHSEVDKGGDTQTHRIVIA
jgi:hypothetical protein